MICKRLSLAIALAFFAVTISATSTPIYLNITALTGDKNRNSVFECWALEPAFATGGSVAVSISTTFGDITNMTYSIAGPKLSAGLHVAPRNQFLIGIGGVALLSLPDSPTTFLSNSAENAFFFAGDTAEVSDKGHYSYYPSESNSVFLQIPTVNNEVPAHHVLYSGPCQDAEYAAIRALPSS